MLDAVVQFVSTRAFQSGSVTTMRQTASDLVPPRRFERPTCPLGGDRSIQLSYEGRTAIFAWIPVQRDQPGLPRLLESTG